MDDLVVALVQQDLIWEDAPANLQRFEKVFQSIAQPCDLVILPEMFSSGFTRNVDKCAEPVNGISYQWMKDKAMTLNFVVSGTILTRENEKYFNRFYWIRPDGTSDYYNKRHLFSMAKEHLVMTRGEERKIVEINGWRINLQVCYDLRFPIWSRNRYTSGQYDYDIVIYAANWPQIRNSAYKKLLPARAIENQSYSVWVNRVGKDGNGVIYSGDSMVVDPQGKVVAVAEKGIEQVLIKSVSYDLLKETRQKLFFAPDWDEFQITK